MGRIVSHRTTCAQAIKLWCICFIWILAVGCREKRDQAAEEFSAASFFVSRMQTYESLYPNVLITNLQQVLTAFEAPYPSRLHYQFRQFGKHSGFQNSVFEKYVLVSRRFTNATVGGDVVLINAESFPDRSGKFGRIICFKWKDGWEGWAMKWFPEDQVQGFFHAAGQTIPKAPSLPPLSDLPPLEKPPLHVRVENFFGGITLNWGLGKAAGPYLMWITFALVVLIALVLCLLGWRKCR